MRLRAFLLVTGFLCSSLVLAQQGDYIAHTEAQFSTACQNAFNCLQSQPAIQALGQDITRITEHYLSQVRAARLPSGQFRLESIELQQAYISLRHLLKDCQSGNFSSLGPAQIATGRHNENSPLLGRRYQDLQRYRMFNLQHQSLLRFANSLYNNSAECPGTTGPFPPALYSIIPRADQQQAAALSMHYLDNYLRPTGLSRQQAVDWNNHSSDSPSVGVTTINDSDNTWNNWCVHSMVSQQGMVINRQYFVPPGLIAIHELGHVERTLPGEPDLGVYPPQNRCIHEIGPTLMQLVQADEIYKTIHHIPLNNEVTYSRRIPGNRGSLSVGAVANLFRRLIGQHSSVEAALMSPEAIRFIDRYYSNVACPSDLTR